MTDLTGTTWHVSSGWSATAGYGKYYVQGSYFSMLTETEGNFTMLAIGYYTPPPDYNFSSRQDYIATNSTQFNNIDNTGLILTFTGGTDATNAALISWLETNGTMLKVTDLTNTTWHIPAGWSAYDVGVFSVDGVFDSVYTTETNDVTFTKLWVGSQDNSGSYTPVENKVVFKGSRQNYAYSSLWSLTITITGGDDVANPSLIAWLQENGEMQTKPTKVFTRLYIGSTVASVGSKCFKRLTTEEPAEVLGNYIRFSSPSSFTLNSTSNKKLWNGKLEYSTDAKTWDEWSGTNTLSAHNGILHLRGTGNTVITGNYSNGGWTLTGTDIYCEGNIENLLDYATVANGEHPSMGMYCFMGLFKGCTSLKTPPKLLSPNVSEQCYYEMFKNCTSLVVLPALYALTYSAVYRCYNSMFEGCTSIKLSKTQSTEYPNEYRIPIEGTAKDESWANVFFNTGGEYMGEKQASSTTWPNGYYKFYNNTTVYTSNTVV